MAYLDERPIKQRLVKEITQLAVQANIEMHLFASPDDIPYLDLINMKKELMQKLTELNFNRGQE